MQKYTLESLDEFLLNEADAPEDKKEDKPKDKEDDKAIDESDDKADDKADDDGDSWKKNQFKPKGAKNKKGTKDKKGAKSLDEDGEENLDESGEDDYDDKEINSILNRIVKDWKAYVKTTGSNPSIGKSLDASPLREYLVKLKKANNIGPTYIFLNKSGFTVHISSTNNKGFKGEPRLLIKKGGEDYYSTNISAEHIKQFKDVLQEILRESSEMFRRQKEHSENEEKEKEKAMKKERLDGFLKENMNRDKYLNIYYDAVSEALEHMGYTEEEAGFILEDGITRGIAENMASKKTDVHKAARSLARSAVDTLTESEDVSKNLIPLNEGLDPSIISYLIGALGVFASAGALAKFQEALAKNPNPKVQMFAKALAQIGSTASNSVIGGTTSRGNKVRENLNEDASLMTLIPYVAGMLGTFITAFGINALMTGLSKSKSNKLRKLGKVLAGAAKSSGSAKKVG
jgi:hypothetical protein